MGVRFNPRRYEAVAIDPRSRRRLLPSVAAAVVVPAVGVAAVVVPAVGVAAVVVPAVVTHPPSYVVVAAVVVSCDVPSDLASSETSTES